MNKENLQKDIEMLNERFGKDTLLSLATIDGNRPTVRIVDAYFENGSFYTIVVGAEKLPFGRFSARHAGFCTPFAFAKGRRK